MCVLGFKHHHKARDFCHTLVLCSSLYLSASVFIGVFMFPIAQVLDRGYPMVTAYRLVNVTIKLWPFSDRLQRILHSSMVELFLAAHAMAFCWIDEWIGTSESKTSWGVVRAGYACWFRGGLWCLSCGDVDARLRCAVL